ncbi:unknown [Candidatus Apopatosoma intestinale]|nr:unknown [Candidatus Apopatosoma intestinale]
MLCSLLPAANVTLVSCLHPSKAYCATVETFAGIRIVCIPESANEANEILASFDVSLIYTV